MLPKAKTVYFHVDVNSAFLSWTAIQHLANGETLDLRTVPAVVGGDEEKRHGVVLAKSIPAKRYGIQTGESLFMARSKYPNLIVAAPDFDWYVKNSKAMIRIFCDYTPDIEQYSIDEAFLNMTGSEGLFGPPLQAAQTIKDRIHRELGFTVNIGIAPNRLLAKMASDFEKPDKIHVLTQDMVPQKLWPLPVGNLFGVGPKSVKRMHEIGIYTIGDLANADADILRGVFGVRGQVFRDYANGIESEPMTRSEVKDNSYGNSVTTPQDLKRPVEADATMLALCESVAGRLRMDGKTARVITVQLVDNAFTALIQGNAEFLGEVVHRPNIGAGLLRGGGVHMVNDQRHAAGIEDLLHADLAEHADGDGSRHVVRGDKAHLAGEILAGGDMFLASRFCQILFNKVHLQCPPGLFSRR